MRYSGSSAGTSCRRCLHADHHGSIIAHSDSSGAVINKLAYDSYGIAATTNIDRFGFTGQAWLSQLGLFHYKARMYSPKLGRFLQTDPIGYEDDLNLYVYVGNDPLNRTDPSGQEECPGGAACTVQGTPQKTNGPNGQAHADDSAARGEQWKQSGEYKRIHYNQSLRTATGDQNASNQRPDVTGIRNNGTVDVHEVTSPSQTNAGQLAKGQNMLQTLPAAQRGTATAAPVSGAGVRTSAPTAPAGSAPGPRAAPGGGMPPGGGIGRALGPVGIGVELLRMVIHANQDPCTVNPDSCA